RPWTHDRVVSDQTGAGHDASWRRPSEPGAWPSLRAAWSERGGRKPRAPAAGASCAMELDLEVLAWRTRLVVGAHLQPRLRRIVTFDSIGIGGGASLGNDLHGRNHACRRNIDRHRQTPPTKDL